MRVGEATGRLRHDVDRVGRPHRAGLVDHLGHVAATHQLHGDEQLLFVLPVVVHLDHVGRLQSREHRRLAREASPEVRVLGQLR